MSEPWRGTEHPEEREEPGTWISAPQFPSTDDEDDGWKDPESPAELPPEDEWATPLYVMWKSRLSQG